MRLPLSALLALPLCAQITMSTEDAKVQALTKAKDWAGLADFIETLSPKDRGRFLVPWMSSLHRAGRHERTLQVSEAVLSQLKDPMDLQVTLPFTHKSIKQMKVTTETRMARSFHGAFPCPAKGYASLGVSGGGQGHPLKWQARRR